MLSCAHLEALQHPSLALSWGPLLSASCLELSEQSLREPGRHPCHTVLSLYLLLDSKYSSISISHTWPWCCEYVNAHFSRAVCAAAMLHSTHCISVLDCYYSRGLLLLICCNLCLLSLESQIRVTGWNTTKSRRENTSKASEERSAKHNTP